MNILVCIKQVPASTKVAVDPQTGVLIRDGSQAKTNPYDLFALECAFRLKEEQGGTVTVLTMGPPQAERTVREAYALGADRGVILSDRRFAGADVLATSYTLSCGIRTLEAEMGHPFDLILCGKQTTDGDTAQVGPEMAEMLGLPSVCGVVALEWAGEDKLSIRMDTGDHVIDAELCLPAVVSVEKDIYVPRLPSYLRRRDLAEREVRIVGLDQLTEADASRMGLSGSPTQVRRIFPPEVSGRRETRGGTAEELAEWVFGLLCDRKWI